MVLPSSHRAAPGPRRAVLIAGPTASGKSGLAAALARQLDATVVNADSMQVYGDLRVLTARPDAGEERQAPHRLYGHVDSATNYSVGRYLADAAALLQRLHEEGRMPVFVGGTGLYVKALTEGLSDVPAVPDAVREAVRAGAEGRATGTLHAELAGRDPEAAARIRPSDRLRILRALEVLAATGRPLAEFQGRRSPGPLHGYGLARVFLAPDRSLLRQRIDERFRLMIEQGALEEVRALAARGLDPALPVMRAHGVPALLAHLRGEIDLAAAIATGQADTRAYVKRQFTWFRGQMPGFVAVAPEQAAASLTEQLAAMAAPT